MTNDELKRRTFELIDSRRDEMVSFLGDYVRHRSINPEREIPEVERGETTACQEWLIEALKSLNCFESVTSWRVSSGGNEMSTKHGEEEILGPGKFMKAPSMVEAHAI
jgi:hypothetical protein